jgi:hypothetical protein
MQCHKAYSWSGCGHIHKAKIELSNLCRRLQHRTNSAISAPSTASCVIKYEDAYFAGIPKASEEKNLYYYGGIVWGAIICYSSMFYPKIIRLFYRCQ